jgi:iron complex transport system ATP-binding protein
MNAVFEAKSASYRVGAKALVADASLALEAGKVTVIVGPNGAGKSSLLRLLSGEITPSSGDILSFGAPLTAIPVWRLACRRAVMAQANRLAFPFAVHEVVRLGIEGIGRGRPDAAITGLIEAALGQADALHLAGRDFQTLSGGEQQRVHFARVLCQLEAGASLEPEQALFLDEPTASLDLRHQIALLQAARAIAAPGRRAVLAVLHDLNLAAAYADTLVVMDRGRIVAAGEPHAVLTRECLREVFGVDLREPGALAPAYPVFQPHYPGAKQAA